ncbi:MAG: 50S ribosomal protein L1 [archaeon]|nr:50S ribosomal protein L1 [archaeon]
MPKLIETIKRVREKSKKRNFIQSFELVILLQNIDFKKKEFSINEIVFLPHAFTNPTPICVFASGDMALRAKNSNVDRVIEPEELDKLIASKREARKIAQNYTFFLAEAPLMSKIGRIFGPYLGPKGKMPSPLPPGAPIESIIARYRSATRVKTKNQLNISCKIGDEGMDDDKIAENSSVVISTVEKKLPLGSKNIKSMVVKLTMGPILKLPVIEA